MNVSDYVLYVLSVQEVIEPTKEVLELGEGALWWHGS